MVPAKALLVFLPMVAGGAWLVVDSTREIGGLQRDLAAIEDARRSAGESFLRTFEGEHVQRQLAAFDRLREVAVVLTRARRNRFLGLLAIGLALLGLAGASLFRRIGRELEEDQRFLQGRPGG